MVLGKNIYQSIFPMKITNAFFSWGLLLNCIILLGFVGFKQRLNKDGNGVITVEEFIDVCQKVSRSDEEFQVKVHGNGQCKSNYIIVASDTVTVTAGIPR